MARTDPSVRYLVRTRLDELIVQLLSTDGRYNDRVDALRKAGKTDHEINSDVLLKYHSGTTKVLSDMIAAMSSYLIATDDRR